MGHVRIGSVLVLLVAPLLLTGCIPPELAKQIPFPIPGITPPPSEETAADSEAIEAESAEEAEAPKPKKPTAPVVFKGQQVTNILPDGLKLVSHIFAAKTGGAARPVIWIIPAIGGRYQDFETLIKALNQKGFSVMVSDLRGQGKSGEMKTGSTVSWRLFSDEDWQKLPKDLSRLLIMWGKTPPPSLGHPLKHLVVLTAGGGSAVLGQALTDWPTNRPKQPIPTVTGFIFYSPQLKAKGLDATDGLLTVDKPVLLLGDPRDSLVQKAWRVMPKLVHAPVTTKTYMQGEAETGNYRLDWGHDGVLAWLNAIARPDAQIEHKPDHHPTHITSTTPHSDSSATAKDH